MNLRCFLTRTCSPILAGALLMLTPMIAGADSMTGSTSANLEGSSHGLGRGERAVSFTELYASSGIHLATFTGSTGSFPFSPTGAAPRRSGALRSHSLESKGYSDGIMSGIFMAERSAPETRFITTTAGSLEGLPLEAQGPLPESTTALFGLALVGFCAFARYGSRAELETV